MAFRLFVFDARYDAIATANDRITKKLEELAAILGSSAFPGYLKEFMVRTSLDPEQEIAIHASSSISGYSDREDGLDKSRIERRRGFMGTNQLEKKRYPNAVHHIKVFFNADGRGRLFYKFEGSIQFIKNARR